MSHLNEIALITLFVTQLQFTNVTSSNFLQLWITFSKSENFTLLTAARSRIWRFKQKAIGRRKNSGFIHFFNFNSIL